MRPIATIDDLLSKVDSKYTLVHLTARRAREINAYYHSLGEGLGQYTPPLVDQVDSNKPLSIAMEEVAADKVVPQYPGDAQRAASELFGAEVVELAAVEDESGMVAESVQLDDISATDDRASEPGGSDQADVADAPEADPEAEPPVDDAS